MAIGERIYFLRGNYQTPDGKIPFKGFLLGRSEQDATSGFLRDFDRLRKSDDRYLAVEDYLIATSYSALCKKITEYNKDLKAYWAARTLAAKLYLRETTALAGSAFDWDL